MKESRILGMDSALLEAKSRPPYNMTISSKLVVEMADKIKLLTAECDELSSRLYDVQWFFCDEDGTPIIENLTIANLEKWLAKRDLESGVGHVKECFSKLESEYRTHGLTNTFTGFDVAQHISAQSKVYINQLIKQAGV